jgi:hypothetical protein
MSVVLTTDDMKSHPSSARGSKQHYQNTFLVSLWLCKLS